MKFIAPEFANINTLRQLASKLGVSTKGTKAVLRERVIAAYRKATSPEAVSTYARTTAKAWVYTKHYSVVSYNFVQKHTPFVIERLQIAALYSLIQFIQLCVLVYELGEAAGETWHSTEEWFDDYYTQAIDANINGIGEAPEPLEVVALEKAKEVIEKVKTEYLPFVKEKIFEAYATVKPQVLQLVTKGKQLIGKWNLDKQTQLSLYVVLGFVGFVSAGYLI